MNHPTAKAPAPGKEEHQVKAKDATLLQLKRRIQIEEAVERVRSRTSRMKESGELAAVASLWVQQVEKLGLIPAKGAIFFSVFDSAEETVSIWLPGTEGLANADYHPIPIRTNKPLEKVYQSWKRKKKLVLVNLSGRSLAGYLKLLSKVPPVRKHRVLKKMIASPPRGLVVAAFSFCQGTVDIIQDSSPSKECLSAIVPFVQVWDQTYTRFLDLQKAEAQVREAQIETALERIRARALAMHSSQELLDVANVMWEQMDALGQPEVSGAVIHLYPENSEEFESWYAFRPAGNKKVLSGTTRFKKNATRLTRQWIRMYYAREKEYTMKVSGAVLMEWRKERDSKFPTGQRTKGKKEPPSNYYHGCDFSGGTMLLATYVEPSREAKNLLKRIAAVFDLAYHRYSDLQKAEAQAREARIEVSLERVRSRAMAMHRSDELREVVGTLYDQLLAAGLDSWMCILAMKNEKLGGLDCFISNHVESVFPLAYHIPDIDHPYYVEFVSGWKEKSGYKVVQLEGKSKKQYDNILLEDTEWKNLPKEAKDVIKSQHHAIVSVAYLKNGMIQAVGTERLPEEKKIILLRFCRVFEQAYTRFLDLQKAEAQAREAQIETALERVRSRTMAMHKSDELSETAAVVFQQFHELGYTPERINIGIVNGEEEIIEFWSTEQGGNQISHAFKASIHEPTTLSKVYAGWKAKEKSLVVDLAGEDLVKWVKHLREVVKMPLRDELIGDRRVHTCAFFSNGCILMTTPGPQPPETINLLERFAGVFNLTYRRFLDLQRAEAQTREAQIEVALERIRARALAMHSSEELVEVANVLREQMGLLGQPELAASAVHLYTEGADTFESWWAMRPATSASGKVIAGTSKFRINTSALAQEWIDLYQSDKTEYTHSASGEKLQAWQNELSVSAPEITAYWGDAAPSVQYFHFSDFSGGSLVMVSYQPPAEETKNLQKRSASVFGLAYRRFLDLKKAEAQAREAQIEASLERVRSRSMAMQNSSELNDILTTIFAELSSLGMALTRCVIWTFNTEDHAVRWWAANPEAENGTESFLIPDLDHPTYYEYWKAWEERRSRYLYELSGETKRTWDGLLFNHTEMSRMPDSVKAAMMAPEKIFVYNTFRDFGVLFVGGLEPLSEENFDIIERFGKVVDQSYTRFKDIRQAEEQAREAKIEAALERVRSQATAMHKSDQLREVVAVVFKELQLSLHTQICILLQFDRKAGEMEWWSTGVVSDMPPECYKLSVLETIKDHPMIKRYTAALDQGVAYSVFELAGASKKSWDEFIFTHTGWKNMPLETKEAMMSFESVVLSDAFMSGGALEIAGPGPLSADKSEILQRFAKVIDFTYTRVDDLQKAEARARDAQKQASLDRVRAEIASMRSTEDLQRITPLVWKELTALRIPFIRCGVFIVDETLATINTYLSAPDGHSLGTLNLQINNSVFTSNIVEHWRKGLVYKDHWDRDQFVAFMESMIALGQIKETASYQGSDSPPESLYLHFINFKQGMLYVGNTEPLTDEMIELVKTLADSFSIAYSRYEDFRQLESAKNRVEVTLSELKATQSQLIQSEKMASLGELTAGIAHEIQNPLNFVNNFSEVSHELLDEMNDEIALGNTEEVKAIANDVKQNLEKILHHGKRADAIVKGMLQHSRSSNGIKEPTDMNELADEYLRLAYHGLRAKDKSFNATMKTEFDETLDKVNVIPQDIGRVVLNLITNAFYAVTDKARTNVENSYEPTVTVITKRSGDQVLVSVKDNGNGILRNVLEKIFQPFFTTKPTGQGTGLGLSLSYDIVKSHGGELKVDTKEGEGSEFIISLPVV